MTVGLSSWINTLVQSYYQQNHRKHFFLYIQKISQIGVNFLKENNLKTVMEFSENRKFSQNSEKNYGTIKPWS
jgi:hypothetical protein